MSKTDVVQFLQNQVALFKEFPADRLAALVAASRVATFERNEAIIEFGEEGRCFGILLAGQAEVATIDERGEKHQIAVIKAGDLFGEMSLMTGDRTTADVIGLSPCKALLIPQDLFSTILVSHPPAIKFLSRIISERSKKMAAVENRQTAASAFQKSEDPFGFDLKSDEPMKILVINCGSSSLKYDLFDTGDENGGARGSVEKIGEDGTRHTFRSARGEVVRNLPRGGHREALADMAAGLSAAGAGVIRSPDEITAIGHRVVHGGDKFTNPVVITDEVLAEIEKLAGLAPLHNPVNVLGIREARRIFATAPHVAVFDTAFHHTLAPYAYLYGLPYDYYENQKIRRYGFHGTSHAYVSLKAAQFLKRPYNELSIISCHLGNGASICAIDHGRSVDTSMGLTPAEGLIMGTRCGDIDPAVLVQLMRKDGLNADQLDHLINRQSGLKGLSGLSNDMREIEKAADEGDHRCLLAFRTFCYRIRKYIGAYVAAMGGLDALIFTAGIGQGSAGVRSVACQGLEGMGIRIDEVKNRAVTNGAAIHCISIANAPVNVLVVPTNEERMIARETLRVLNSRHIAAILRNQEPVPVPIEVSAHHIHLTQELVEALFGQGHQLTVEHELSQPGQFACKEQATLIGPKGRIERVRVLGPARKETQIEIAMTEQFKLGIQAPIRESGDVRNSPGITLEGPRGRIALNQGVICALRHVHLAPEDALRLGLRDKYMVRVRVEGDRELIFGDVLVRVHPNFRLAMHIDTDEANAAGIKTGRIGYIDGIQSRN
ncbi:MAG: acetate/propionate family kinase [Verrucomicrobia bacterium]|nr:acetate/propionate family kinase [Verrucomicrobiota bacterium]